MHPKFQFNHRSFLGCHFRSYKNENFKTKTKSTYLKYFVVAYIGMYVHCVPELYANQNFCDNFGNIQQNLMKFQY